MSRLITFTIVIGLGWYFLLPVFQNRALDLYNAPYLNPATRYGVEKTYEAQSPTCRETYVLAISTAGNWFQACGARATPAELRHRALTICGHQSGGECGVWVAEGQPVPFTLVDPGPDYSRIYSPSRIPFIRAEVRDYLAYHYDRADGRKALAITRFGHWGIATGHRSDAEANAAALAACDVKTGAAGRCFLYATGIGTVFTPDTNIYPDRPR